MLTLEGLQAHLAMTALDALPAPELLALIDSKVGAERVLEVHRENVRAGLVRALRLGYPTVEGLLGSEFFRQCAEQFACMHPPKVATLSLYGADFPAWIAQADACRDFRWLRDVARFDRALDEVDHAGTSQRPVVFTAAYPVDELREAVTRADEAALSQIDLAPATRRWRLWRGIEGPCSRRLE